LGGKEKEKGHLAQGEGRRKKKRGRKEGALISRWGRGVNASRDPQGGGKEFSGLKRKRASPGDGSLA